AIFVDAGISYAIIRTDYGMRYYKAISNLSMFVGFILFLIVIILAYPICLFYNDYNLLIPTILLGSTFIIRSVSVVPSAILKKNLLFNKIGQVRFLGAIVQIGLTIVLAYLGFSYWSLIVPTIIHAVITNVMLGYMASFRFRFFPVIYLRLALRTTRSLMANITGFNLINYWSRNADNLIIGKVYGAADLGIYNRAYRLLDIALSSTTNLFGQVLFPSLKELKAKGGDVKKEFTSLLGIISLISFPIGAIMIVFAKPFVRFMWGENWMSVADLLPYFGVLVLIQSLLATLGNIYVLHSKEKTLFIIGGISAVVMIIAIVIGSFYSMVHVAFYYALSNVLFNVPLNLILGFRKALNFKIREILIFWLPKLMLTLGILIFIWYNLFTYTIIATLLYLIHVVYLQRSDISRLFVLIKEKIKPRSI
ncbi:MAG: oligosaccharide flippase family protein, partial [Bacteroidales bacterium]|nr:oligosaccharide flippase family protein [Bacteroidales bacterium]